MTDKTFTVPGFDVVELLGFGATGEVWLAREVSTGDLVALKRVRATAGAGLAARDRIRREAAVLSAIEHPHLLRLRAVLSCPDGLVLVLDHAAGGSLEGLLAARGTLSAGEVVTLGVPLAQALATIHARSVVHGDVCPANVLWTAAGRPVLADLGVARVVGESVEEIATTRDWADPALALGAVPEPASDVFGLAAVCFTALAGLPPFGEGVRRDLASLAPTAPPALVAAVEAGLAPVTTVRPTAAEFAAALYAAADAQPVTLVRGDGLVVVEVAGDDDGRAEARTVGTPVPRPAVPPAATRERSRLRRRRSRSAARAPHGSQAGAPAARTTPPATTRRAPAPGRPDAATPGAARRRAAAANAGRPWRIAGRPWRIAGTVAGAAVALLAAAVTGVVWAGAGDAADGATITTAGSGATAAQPTPGGDSTSAPVLPIPATDWVRVLTDLYAVREQAYARADTELLTGVYAPGSPDLAYTRDNVERLAAAGASARDVALRVVSAAPVDRAPQAGDRAVTLRVVDELGPSTVVTQEGAIGGQLAGRGRATAEIELARSGSGWRIVRTQPAA